MHIVVVVDCDRNSTFIVISCLVSKDLMDRGDFCMAEGSNNQGFC